jgi:hypothetical protein
MHRGTIVADDLIYRIMDIQLRDGAVLIDAERTVTSPEELRSIGDYAVHGSDGSLIGYGRQQVTPPPRVRVGDTVVVHLRWELVQLGNIKQAWP